MGRRFYLAAVLAFSVTPALAEALTDFVPQRDGAISCWQRDYDSAHLERHPDQQVTGMTFGMIYQAERQDMPEIVAFGVDVSLRGGQSGEAGGPCYANEGQVWCGVECDGGGFVLTQRDDGNLLLDLETRGYVRLHGECSGGDEETTIELESGKDDKQFLLHRTDAKLCKALVVGW